MGDPPPCLRACAIVGRGPCVGSSVVLDLGNLPSPSLPSSVVPYKGRAAACAELGTGAGLSVPLRVPRTTCKRAPHPFPGFGVRARYAY
jgi:hypothetical protein